MMLLFSCCKQSSKYLLWKSCWFLFRPNSPSTYDQNPHICSINPILSLCVDRSCWAWRTTWRSLGTFSWTFSWWWRNRAPLLIIFKPTWKGHRILWTSLTRSSSWLPGTRRRTRCDSCAAVAALRGDAAYRRRAVFRVYARSGKIHIFNFKHDSRVGNNRRWISSAMTWRLWCCGFCRTVVKSDASERRKQLAGGEQKKPEPVFEALVSFKRMWGGCYWKRQFSKCNSPALLLIGDLHCHETEVTNKGRPLPLLQPLLDQQVGHFNTFPFFFLFFKEPLTSLCLRKSS